MCDSVALNNCLPISRKDPNLDIRRVLRDPEEGFPSRLYDQGRLVQSFRRMDVKAIVGDNSDRKYRALEVKK